ncbi:hypothetical protein BDV93DRAFT_392228, partial [Ceratobasidium sp. AG-I]
DKPGEELQPDATIWKHYVAEATEHDEELTSEKNLGIDIMLIFAALFSAILTAFLLDSKNSMKAGGVDFTNDLLIILIKRMDDPSLIFNPEKMKADFKPEVSARWINGLWFTSLALSLAAALLGMMAKEWLNAFKASRPRPA